MSDWTEIICILDRSGSMGHLTDDTIGGFNAFLDQQRAEQGKARVSLVLFDDKYEVPWKHVDVKSAPKLDKRVYQVRGSTALLDALGRTITGVRSKIQGYHQDEKPGHVVVLVMTDGYENASREYAAAHIKTLVELVQGEGWEFVFVGADIDAFAASQDLAFAQGSATNVERSSQGMREAYSKMGRAVSNIRKTGQKGDVDAPLSEDGWL